MKWYIHITLSFWYDGDENEPDFERAWKLQASRAKEFHISRLCREPRLLQYAEFGKVGQQIERLLSIFPPQTNTYNLV